MTFRGLFGAVSASERKFIWAVSVVAAAVTSLPAIASWHVARAGSVFWTGVGIFGRGDVAVYLSYIIQASRGQAFMQDLFTTEPVQRRLDVFWYAVGQLARIPHVSPLAAFQASRILLIPVLAWVAYLCIAHILRDRTDRTAAFLVFMFASGVGAYCIPFLGGERILPGLVRYPTDLWVPESVPFLSMSYSPHFIASFILVIASAMLLLRSFTAGSLRLAASAGFTALILFGFHPFHAPTLYAVPFAYLLVRWYADRKPPLRTAASYALFVGISAPAVLYHYLRLMGTPTGSELLTANLTLTPSLPYVLAGFGVLLPLAVWGIVLARRAAGATERTYLIVWAVVQGGMFYTPLTFQRRLMEGIAFPIAVFAGIALAELWRRRPVSADMRGMATLWVALVAVAFLLLPSNAGAIVRGLSLLSGEGAPALFFGEDDHRAFAWMRKHLDADSTVLSSFDSGNLIPAQTGVRTYAGHPVETIDAADKSLEIDAFFHDMTPEQQRTFLEENGISHVYDGPREHERYGESDLSWLTAEFSAGEVTIYGTGK